MSTCWCVFDVAAKRAEIDRLEEESSATAFWHDQGAAQAAMQRLADLRSEVEPWERLVADARSAAELVAIADGDELSGELEVELAGIEARLEEMQLALLFGGPHDDMNAIVAIHAGAGGTESQDWAEMLLRMYLRWAEEQRFKTEILDRSAGEEAGHQERYRAGDRGPMPTAAARPSGACIAWCGCRRLTRRTAGTPRSPWSR